ncbi:major facilitator superfamily domain-containing protein [Zychaea mexicana]|uniref:major facilitator superfamily domain-containing protein n=1 Tax=Zychaea mexicana TaxID=64656 RepID=UPI0022FF0E77|nr:major facilitator superfamily domain-containing protein [Zychaea mexicana]KAI9492274.1 major facilitator superfamily domain-containing protein [Zychaea mexicana]
MDRTNLSNAISDNLAQDLGFTNDDVNTTIMVYAILFTIFALPSNFVSKRIGAHLWIPILMNSWGDLGGFFAIRVLIAITEAGFIPACIYYLSSWYKTKELATRLAWFWGIQSLASAFSGLISFGVFRMRGIGGLEGWKWLFLLDGIFTHIVGVFCFFYLPGRPSRTQGLLRGKKGWFNERQMRIAVTRLIRDDLSKTEQHNSRITLEDIKSTVLDTKVWTHLITTFIGFVPITPITTYLPSMIRDGGFETTTANLLTVPSYIINGIFSILIAWSSDRHGEVSLHCMIGVIWSLACFAALRALPADTDRWNTFGAAMMAAASPSWHGMHIAFMSSNVAPVGKRVLCYSAIIASANICAVPGAVIYQTWDAPRYYYGNTINIILIAILGLLFMAQRLRYDLTNRWRARKWGKMSEEERQHYRDTTKDTGSNRLDFRFYL